MNLQPQNWQQKRKDDLESNMKRIIDLIGSYEKELTYEEDPAKITKIRDKIVDLKAQQKECQDELNSCEQAQLERKSLALTMTSITDEDIGFVIAALLRQRVFSCEDQDDFRLTNPEQKMSKNGLTSDIRISLEMGLGKAREVRYLIEKNAKINFPDVPEKLRAALNAEYLRLVEEGIQGDELFKRLHNFSSCQNPDIKWITAGLAILGYFFETCDVFEP